LIKAADMMIARRADTKARADFATWKMMAKLNGASALPEEAPKLPRRLQGAARSDARSPRRATPPSILIYRNYYGEMGGVGLPPDVKAHANEPVKDNVTAFTRPPAPRQKSGGRPDPTQNPGFRWP